MLKPLTWYLRGSIGPPRRSSIQARTICGFLAMGTGGNLTSDAHLAALAIEYGAELCSSDADFARFPGLKWRDPLR